MSNDERRDFADAYMLERLLVSLLRYRWTVVGAAVLGFVAAGLALSARTGSVVSGSSASAQLLMPHGAFRAVAAHDVDGDLAILRSGAVRERAEATFGSPLEIAADRVEGTDVLAMAVTISKEEGASAAAQAVFKAFEAVRHDVLSSVLESQSVDVVNRLESLPAGDGGGSVVPGGSDAPIVVPGGDVGGDGPELAYRRAVLGERLDEIEVALSSLKGTEPIAITGPADEEREESGDLPIAPVLAIGALGGLAFGVFLAWSIPYLGAARRIVRRIEQGPS